MHAKKNDEYWLGSNERHAQGNLDIHSNHQKKKAAGFSQGKLQTDKLQRLTFSLKVESLFHFSKSVVSISWHHKIKIPTFTNGLCLNVS